MAHEPFKVSLMTLPPQKTKSAFEFSARRAKATANGNCAEAERGNVSRGKPLADWSVHSPSVAGFPRTIGAIGDARSTSIDESTRHQLNNA
jgi:hypothetical protein